MKILVTGGNGFIGSHLTKALREKYNGIDDQIITVGRKRMIGGDPSQGFFFYTPIGSDKLAHHQKDLGHATLDLNSKEATKRLMDRFQPEIIFHLAANPLGKTDWNNPWQLWKDNTHSTMNICQYAPKGAKVYFASSVVVYSGETLKGFNEWDAANTISLYGASKLASESIINAYTEAGRIEGYNFRLCATVGSGLTHGILFDFIRKLKSDSEKLDVLGAYPGTTKPYSHIDDVVGLMIQSIDIATDSPLNVVPDDAITVDELANTVMDTLGIHKEINWLGDETIWKGDNKIISVDNLKYKIAYRRKYPTSKEAIIQAVNDIK